jgi:hypothetical protein
VDVRVNMAMGKIKCNGSSAEVEKWREHQRHMIYGATDFPTPYESEKGNVNERPA